MGQDDITQYYIMSRIFLQGHISGDITMRDTIFTTATIATKVMIKLIVIRFIKVMNTEVFCKTCILISCCVIPFVHVLCFISLHIQCGQHVNYVLILMYIYYISIIVININPNG